MIQLNKSDGFGLQGISVYNTLFDRCVLLVVVQNDIGLIEVYNMNGIDKMPPVNYHSWGQKIVYSLEASLLEPCFSYVLLDIMV